MDYFPENFRLARKRARLSQTVLGQMVGVTQRTITDYETGRRRPHHSTLVKLTEALHVTEADLYKDPNMDPETDKALIQAIEAARLVYGSAGQLELSELFSKNVSLFAGGSISQEAKDAYFNALSVAYMAAKKQAKSRYSSKDKKEQASDATPTDEA